jgi:hypothetical protein
MIYRPLDPPPPDSDSNVPKKFKCLWPTKKGGLCYSTDRSNDLKIHLKSKTKHGRELSEQERKDLYNQAIQTVKDDPSYDPARAASSGMGRLLKPEFESITSGNLQISVALFGSFHCFFTH